MTLQQVIEKLLRARLFRARVRIRTRDGQDHDVQVRDVRFDGSRSLVDVTEKEHEPSDYSITLTRIARVELPVEDTA